MTKEFQWHAADEREQFVGEGKIVAENEQDAYEKVLRLLDLLDHRYEAYNKTIRIRILPE